MTLAQRDYYGQLVCKSKGKPKDQKLEYRTAFQLIKQMFSKGGDFYDHFSLSHIFDCRLHEEHHSIRDCRNFKSSGKSIVFN